MPGSTSATASGYEHSGSVSGRATSVAAATELLVADKVKCCCCKLSGNAISLLTAFALFSTITMVQYYYAIIANSNALKADCVSMGVDSLAFLANLFAECLPEDSAIGKRRVELTMSGISHVLLLAFTISFIMEGLDSVQNTGPYTAEDDEDSVNGYIVLIFAIGGLLFDFISLASYHYFGGDSGAKAADADADADALKGIAIEAGYPGGDARMKKYEEEDSLTCGINTNMCAALLHVLSDLLRSTTTMCEAIVILNTDINSEYADGVSTLAVCSIIVIGATAALLTWMREVYLYMTMPPPRSPSIADGSRNNLTSPMHYEPRHT